MSKLECDNEEKKRYVFEGYDLISKALELNDSHYAVHKWYSIFLDTRSAYDGIKARVTQLPNVKKHLLVCADISVKCYISVSRAVNASDELCMLRLLIWLYR
jgi:hypothetical protein